MKEFCSMTIFATCLLSLPTMVGAQDCSNLTNWDLRGTYIMAGSGWADLSKAFSNLGFPSGMSPISWVGAHTNNGAGGGTGWVSFNMGGTQLNVQFVGLNFVMRSDCSLLVTYSLKWKELGHTTGPYTSLKVVVPKPGGELEQHAITTGNPVGTPAQIMVTLEVLHRISIQY